ncbi:MAG TPA: M17 family peptidase N-terminal domain-containing protein, partial [Streptomyces sp.]|nr:M17 family peptidase N-terminal domain-containing protein [Streptomyces sp.]
MSALTLSTSSAVSLSADALVVGVAKGSDGPVVAAGGEAVDQAFGGKLATSLKVLGASGSEGEVTKLPSPDGVEAELVLAVGLGDAPEKDSSYEPEALRRAAGTAARALSGKEKAAFALPAGDAATVAAVCEGALLGAYA